MSTKQTTRKSVSWTAAFFIGSPLAFIVMGVLQAAGVPVYAAVALGALAVPLAGKALLSSI